MLIRSPISRDFYEPEPHSADWAGHAIVFIALLAGVAALFYAIVNFDMTPSKLDGLGCPSNAPDCIGQLLAPM